MGSPKPGTYPMADRANIFGTLFVGFYEKWNGGGDMDACKPTFRGIVNIAKSKADSKFNRHYHLLVTAEGGHVGEPTKDGDCPQPFDCKKKTLTIDDMDAIVGECWQLMDRIGTYDYEQGPQDEEEIRIPVAGVPAQ